MWKLSGELAVNCSTLVDLPRQMHGLRWMRDELMAPPNRRLTLNGADDVQHWRQTLSGRTSILALLHSSSRAPAHTTYGYGPTTGGISPCGRDDLPLYTVSENDVVLVG